MADSKQQIEKRVAEFSQSRNDMYWKLYDSEDGFIRWTGYDDDFWWENIATDPKRFNREGAKSGKIYWLDPHTNDVAVYPAAQVAA